MPDTLNIPIPSGQIVWLVNRLHVGTSDTGVVRDFYRRMRGKPAFTKRIRKAIYRYAIQQHNGNRGFYAAVQAGRI